MEMPMTAVAGAVVQGVGVAAVLGAGGRLEIGDALAQDGNEVAHDVRDGMLHAEEIGVEVALGDAVADLAVQAGVELVLGDGLQHGAAVIGRGILRVVRHVHGLRGDGDLVDLFPRPFEIRPARRDDAHLRIVVALLFLGAQASAAMGSCSGGGVAHALGAAEAGLHRALVLVDGVKAGGEIADEEPDDEADDASEEYCGHK